MLLKTTTTGQVSVRIGFGSSKCILRVNVDTDGNNSGLSLAEIEGFIEASDGVEFQSQERVEMYGWVEATLVNWEYHLQGKKQKGTIRSYLRKITGLSMSQVTRLIRLHRKSGYVKTSRKPRR